MISKRLKEIAKLLDGSNILLDVGTDHAFLPIYAIKSGYINSAIATDINTKPIENANKNIADALLEDKIKTYVYDGIIENDADCIVIAGMGGELIINILEKTLNNAKNLHKLILAPNNHEKELRCFLSSKFNFIDEKIINDKNFNYEIMVLEYGNQKLDEFQTYFGPINLLNKSKEFIDKCKKRLTTYLSIIDGITDSNKKQEMNKEIEMIKKVLGE